jgi:hypothetical protein
MFNYISNNIIYIIISVIMHNIQMILKMNIHIVYNDSYNKEYIFY